MLRKFALENSANKEKSLKEIKKLPYFLLWKDEGPAPWVKSTPEKIDAEPVKKCEFQRRS